MIERRSFDSLGGADHGWLKAKHHFSFASYFDPNRTQWGNLRVWNDDEIAAGSGFPPHPHADMEIITYVREGAITHEDSLGNKGRTEAGDGQVMSAGTGIRHAEYNAEPDTTRPTVGDAQIARHRAGQFVVLASGFDDDGDALPIRTDARVVGATLKAGESADYALGATRRGYLVPAKGEVEVNGVRLNARDGAAISGEDVITVTAVNDAEIVLVDAA